jgi:hypothetical protein
MAWAKASAAPVFSSASPRDIIPPTVAIAGQSTDLYVSLNFTQPNNSATIAARGIEIAGVRIFVTAITMTPSISSIVITALSFATVGKEL